MGLGWRCRRRRFAGEPDESRRGRKLASGAGSEDRRASEGIPGPVALLCLTWAGVGAPRGAPGRDEVPSGACALER